VVIHASVKICTDRARIQFFINNGNVNIHLT